jgi:ATP-binding cassette subfamily B protein
MIIKLKAIFFFLILILDDSVSAVDTETEATILSNLRKERKNKTTIFVAHRISTIESLDKIIVIDDGMVSGVGTHLELLKTNKLYQEMVHLQNLETKIENGGDTNAD